jgi:hypothetical protein
MPGRQSERSVGFGLRVTNNDGGTSLFVTQKLRCLTDGC